MLVLYDRQDRIATLELNRPSQLNALTPTLFEELRAHVDAIQAAAAEIDVLVLRGAGRAFCAGFDLKEGRNELKARYRAGRAMSDDFMGDTVAALANLPMPVVTAVQGYCMTGGLELALAGDLIVAAADAVFADTHGKFAFNARWGLTQRLPRRIGATRAKDMVFTGRRVEADEALRIGLADRLFANETFAADIATLVQQIAGQSTGSLRRAKQMIDRSADLPLAEGLALEASAKPFV